MFLIKHISFPRSQSPQIPTTSFTHFHSDFSFTLLLFIRMISYVCGLTLFVTSSPVQWRTKPSDRRFPFSCTYLLKARIWFCYYNCYQTLVLLIYLLRDIYSDRSYNLAESRHWKYESLSITSDRKASSYCWSIFSVYFYRTKTWLFAK